MFPQMTLRGALHRYFLPDKKEEICALRHFCASDVANIKNGKKILSSLNHLIKFMIDELKKKNKYYDKPTNDEVNTMYQFAIGTILALSKNNRSESFSWRTHYKNVEVVTRKKIIIRFINIISNFNIIFIFISL